MRCYLYDKRFIVRILNTAVDTLRYVAGACRGGSNQVHRPATHGAVSTSSSTSRYEMLRNSCRPI